jgi:hypothetical protein
MRATALLLIGVMAGCAGGSGGPDRPGAPVAASFPAPEELYALREQPLEPGSPFGTTFRDVGRWELGGPFPEVAEVAPRPGGRAWDGLLDDLLAGRAGLAVASVAMECYARESGRFLLEHRALPGLALQRFLAGRCAVVTAPPLLATLGWEAERELPLDRAIEELGGDIAEALRRHAVGGPLDVGLWVHSDAGRVDVVIAWGERVARVDPLATELGDSREVVLRGELLRGAAATAAAVTRGRFGWQECEPHAEVALPRFQFACPIDPADPTTWVSLSYLPPGAILERQALSLLVRAPGQDAREYRRHPYTGPRRVDHAGEVAEALVGLVNQVRAEAGLAPVADAPEQSRVAGELAPHYFSALFDPGSERIAELVAVGMMAGWELPEIVQEGRFSSMWLVESRDVASLLSDALEHPGSRMALLAPEVERIAVGAVAGEGDEALYVAAIASTYQLFSEVEHRANAERVAGGLTRARAARARAAPRTLDTLVPLAVAAAARVQAGGAPQDVLGDLIRESVDTLGRSVMGWVVEAQDLDAIAFPDDFLDRPDLEVAIAVSVHRPAGEAWGRYVVLVVAAQPEARPL